VKPRSIERLRCPRCLGEGRESPFEVDLAREDEAGDVLEAFLVCGSCRDVRVVVQGIAVVPTDVLEHFRGRGNVYRRAVVAEPRLARFVLARVGLDGADFVPFEEVVERYGDLASPARPASHGDRALDAALRGAGAEGPALEVGCGVGRGTFALAARCGEALGCDRSDARLRRARHVQTAAEFVLPAADGLPESPIDVARLARSAVDFLVADPMRLPLAAGAFETVVLRSGDGTGPWADVEAVRAECARVLTPSGLLIVESAGGWRPVKERVAR
jgi:hypothetical protein